MMCSSKNKYVSGDVRKIQSRDARKEMEHRVRVAQALEEAQPAPQQRIVEAEDLRHATRPTNALTDVTRQTLGLPSRPRAPGANTQWYSRADAS